jgi:SAM-dependent methyltransferase
LNIKRLIGKNPLGKKLISQLSKDEVQNYWKNPNDPEFNSPETYLESTTKNTQILLDIVNDSLDKKEIKILELGCNVGRNINKLFENGFKNLFAIEINSEAINLMKKSFPNTFSSTKIFESSIENKIKEFPDNEFDLVFSMAVLMHIHNDSDWIFQHIARITKKNLIIMENENIKARKNFPRNYKNIFEKFGLKEKKSFNLEDGYICRIFSRQSS